MSAISSDSSRAWRKRSNIASTSLYQRTVALDLPSMRLWNFPVPDQVAQRQLLHVRAPASRHPAPVSRHHDLRFRPGRSTLPERARGLAVNPASRGGDLRVTCGASKPRSPWFDGLVRVTEAPAKRREVGMGTYVGLLMAAIRGLLTSRRGSRSRTPRPQASACDVRPPAQSAWRRPRALGHAVPMLDWLAFSAGRPEPGHRRALAPEGLAPVLAVEEPSETWGPPQNRSRGSRAHRPDRARASPLGCDPAPWRAARSGTRREHLFRSPVPATGVATATFATLAYVHHEPPPRALGGGLLHRPDVGLPDVVRLRRGLASPPAHRARQCHCPPDGG